jgi:hypothetical protein
MQTQSSSSSYSPQKCEKCRGWTTSLHPCDRCQGKGEETNICLQCQGGGTVWGTPPPGSPVRVARYQLCGLQFCKNKKKQGPPGREEMNCGYCYGVGTIQSRCIKCLGKGPIPYRTKHTCGLPDEDGDGIEMDLFPTQPIRHAVNNSNHNTGGNNNYSGLGQTGNGNGRIAGLQGHERNIAQQDLDRIQPLRI